MSKDTITVEIKVKRGNEAQGKTYQLIEVGESRKGNYKLFSAAGDTPDIPEFGKVYIKVKRNGK